MEIHTGDRVLVDTTPYGLPGPHWCEVAEITTATASRWQLRVRVAGHNPHRVGEYRREELMDHHPKTTRQHQRTPPQRGAIHPI